MDGMGCITHDYSTPRLDKQKEYQRNKSKEKRRYCAKDPFEINPKWGKAFAGREEYE